MNWNNEQIPMNIALHIGWNLPIDVVGAGVYGGIVKRNDTGAILIGDEWPEDNRAPPAHNPVHSTGPYLDFSKHTSKNRGYTKIASVIQSGDASRLEALLEGAGGEVQSRKLANLVMTGGARPLHMCGMGRGKDRSEMIKLLLAYGADVNAKDNYEMTPMERLSSNQVTGNQLLRAAGGKVGRQLPRGVPKWDSEEFDYVGPGEVDELSRADF
jgi:hypothetical protein